MVDCICSSVGKASNLEGVTEISRKNYLLEERERDGL